MPERFTRVGNINMHSEPTEVPPEIERQTDFMCRCGPKRYKDTEYAQKYESYEEDGKTYGRWVQSDERYEMSENEQRCIDMLADVKERLGATDSNLLSGVVFSLNWDFGAHLTAIENDQWSGVAAETYDPGFKTYVQCDHVEDGIARTWQMFADKFPEKWER